MRNVLRQVLRRAYRIPAVEPAYQACRALALLLLYAASFLAPRSRTKWLFGCHNGQFRDNSKYLYLHVVQEHRDIRAIWVCHRRADLAYFAERGLPACYVRSLRGLYHCLTAKVYCYSFYPTDINFHASGGAILLNLWHGIGLKRVEFNDTISPSGSIYHWTLGNVIRRPWLFRRPSFVLSTSRFVTDYFFTGAFRVRPERCLEFGYPRNDPLFWSKQDFDAHVARFEDRETCEVLTWIEGRPRAFIYLPTYRDDGAAVLNCAGIDLVELDRALARDGTLLLLKLHMNDAPPDDRVAALAHVRFLSGAVDIYPFLRQVSGLVTDYSSVYYDIILRPAVNVILFPFDLTRYQSVNRQLHFPYDEAFRGERVHSASELYEALGHPRPAGGGVDRRAETHRFWGDRRGGASERITCFLKSELGLES